MWVVSFWVGLRVSFWAVSASLLEWVGSGSRGGIDKNLRKNISSNINLKCGSCRYVHAE